MRFRNNSIKLYLIPLLGTFATFIIISCKSQVLTTATIIPLSSINSESFNILNSGKYFKDIDNRYDYWVGTWEYINGNTIFRISIQKNEGVYFPKKTSNIPIPINCYTDILTGGYFYQENGITITNHLLFSDVKNPPIFCSSVYFYPDTINNKLTIVYREIEKFPGLSGGIVNFTLLPGSTNQAMWEFDSTNKRNYSVPDNVILTKLP